MFTVKQFVESVSNDLNGLIDSISRIDRNITDREIEAMHSSYTEVSKMLSKAMSFNPNLSEAHLSTSTDLMLEYRLPSAPAWCDLVLLGKKNNGKKEVIIVELKNWLRNSDDAPGRYEGIIMHKGTEHLHPAEQVRGYQEYCQYFHSEVLKQEAEVRGVVYFTQPINLMPYEAAPNDKLVAKYPCFNIETANDLASLIAMTIEKSDTQFAKDFKDGKYQQDRNILLQVAQNLRKAEQHNVRPFVLLKDQKLAYNKVMETLKDCFESGRKTVVIITGGPGTGKSAVATNIWMDAANDYALANSGNIIYVATSSAQENNWRKIFKEYGGKGANGMIFRANDFNPGFNNNTIRENLIDIYDKEDRSKYIRNERNNRILRPQYFREYIQKMVENEMISNYREKKNRHFLSVIDEAHALINPLAPGFRSNKFGGWPRQMGPQVYHIIYESLVSVFLLDGKQSYRDLESTSVEDIKTYAKEMDAETIEISLDGLQFRCGGSREYTDWVENMFDSEPYRNHRAWKNLFEIKIVDDPYDIDAHLRKFIDKGDISVRILSSYSRKWLSANTLDAMHHGNAEYDFSLDSISGKKYNKYWNNPKSYDIYVMGSNGSKMAEDPLCEVGCPYVVRGFDWNHTGLLWLDDLVWRESKGEWVIKLAHVEETALASIKKEAVEEYKLYLNGLGKKLNPSSVELPTNNPKLPKCKTLFKKIVGAYRILFTRAMKGVCIYFLDAETRRHVEWLLEEIEISEQERSRIQAKYPFSFRDEDLY